jgi:hypothetical protein
MTLAVAIAPAFAHAGSLPPLINFQSVLLDEGGNLLPSGPTTVQFQILDENQAPIYSETQSVDVVKGAVAALIGNGTDSKGTTTGGVPEDIFASGAPRYLQVQVGSHAPEAPMTIVPVPYAQWSETCATVVDGGITSNAIAKAAVGFEALAPDVVSKLADEMSKSQGVVTAQALGAAGGATQVGVEAKFINSGSSSVQGVLQDLDLSAKKSQEMDAFLKGKLNQEITDRTDAVAGVQGKLDQEVKDRTAADTGLQGQITKEISDRSNAITQEQQARSAGDSSLQSLLSQEAVTRANADTAFSQTLSNINNIPGTLSFDKVKTSTPPPSDLNMGGHKITNLAEPTALTDAATKKYIDGAIASTKSVQDLAIAAAQVNAAKIATGTYVGNGAATQTVQVNGIRIRAIFLFNPNQGPAWGLGTDASLNGSDAWGGVSYNGSTEAVEKQDNGVKSLNTNSFTVANGWWNAAGQTIFYIAIGEAS